MTSVVTVPEVSPEGMYAPWKKRAPALVMLPSLLASAQPTMPGTSVKATPSVRWVMSVCW